MLDNKVGMQNRKMVGFINMGEFFYRARKAERWGVCANSGAGKKQGGQGSESWRYFKGYLRQLWCD